MVCMVCRTPRTTAVVRACLICPAPVAWSVSSAGVGRGVGLKYGVRHRQLLLDKGEVGHAIDGE